MGQFLNWRAGFNETFYMAELPGPIETLSDAYNNEQHYIGYDLFKREVYLGFMNSFNRTTDPPISTPYGDIVLNTYNMTSSGFKGTKSIMSAWGIRCRLYRQSGLSTFTRVEIGSSWTRNSSTFSGDKSPIILRIAEWQQSLNTKGAFYPGLATALAGTTLVCADNDTARTSSNCTTDFKALANNFLFAAGESERITYEVDAQNAARANGTEDGLQVQATTREQFYQITYVPIILIARLVSLLACALITSGMVVYSWKTLTFRSWREVSALRLLIDSAAGLKDGTFEEVKDVGNKDLAKWRHAYGGHRKKS